MGLLHDSQGGVIDKYNPLPIQLTGSNAVLLKKEKNILVLAGATAIRTPYITSDLYPFLTVRINEINNVMHNITGGVHFVTPDELQYAGEITANTASHHTIGVQRVPIQSTSFTVRFKNGDSADHSYHYYLWGHKQ